VTPTRPAAPAAPAAGARRGAAGPAVLAAGLVFLLARPALPGGAALLAAGYLALFAAAVALPAASRPARAPLGAGSVLAVGVAAVVAARALALPAPVPPATAAAVAFGLAAAVAEEALFRRLLYGRLERFGPAVAVVGTALLFGLVHLPAYGVAALPVDLGAGLLLSWQRHASGSWAVPAATHAVANLLAVI
jgi:membrane protease YdiL (CAAX protease family)